MDHAQCRQQGETAVSGNPAITAPPGTPAANSLLMQRLQVYTYCMRGKGWQQVPAR